MSERVLHEWVTESGRHFRLFADSEIWLDKERGRMLLSGWEPAFARELSVLAARVTELEAENAKLHDAILDIYNAHQDEALEIRMRECGRWTEIRALVGEANDRAARAEVKL